MGGQTGIEWTDATWNPVAGCTAVSPGCRNCYAARQALRLQANPQTQAKYAGTARKTADGRPVFTGRVNLAEHVLDQPLSWQRPRRIFVNSMSDLFHPEVPDEWVDRIWAVMALSPRHTFQVLTKRPERMAAYLRNPDLQDRLNGAAVADTDREDMPSTEWPLPNVWLGTSVEDQERAEERVPYLLRCPAAIRFLSCEPLLGPVELDYDWLAPPNPDPLPLNGQFRLPGVQWVIAGGESGPRARPMDPDWARALRDQCRGARVFFFFKQWGAWVSELHPAADVATQETSAAFTEPGPDGDYAGLLVCRVGKKAAGRELDGRIWEETPLVRSCGG